MKKVLVIGSLNIDNVINVSRMPVKGETIQGKSFKLVPGGKGANQAYTLGKLNADVKMLGALGNDDNGKILLNSLKSAHVDTSFIKISENGSTGCAFIEVDDKGENSIVIIPGANKEVDIDLINENIDLINWADIIVMQLEIPFETVLYTAKLAKDKKKMVVLDPAPAIKDINEDIFKYVDIIKPNETELQILTNIDTNKEENIIKAGKVLLEKGVKAVITTLGENGSYLITNDNCKHFPTIKVDTIDTTAAGDSFTGALVKALALNKNIEEAIKYAHVISAIVVTKSGAQTSIPSEEEVKQFIERM